MLEKSSVFSSEDKEEVIGFIQKILNSKNNCQKEYDKSIGKIDKEMSRLSCGTFEEHSMDGEIQPTYIDIFSKFD